MADPADIEADLPVLLQHKRQQNGLSLRQLGDRLGLSFSTLARIERGQGKPDRHTHMLLEQWINPESPVSCSCKRCDGSQAVDRLRLLEERLVILETRLEQVHASLLFFVKSFQRPPSREREIPHG